MPFTDAFRGYASASPSAVADRLFPGITRCDVAAWKIGSALAAGGQTCVLKPARKGRPRTPLEFAKLALERGRPCRPGGVVSGERSRRSCREARDWSHPAVDKKSALTPSAAVGKILLKRGAAGRHPRWKRVTREAGRKQIGGPKVFADADWEAGGMERLFRECHQSGSKLATSGASRNYG